MSASPLLSRLGERGIREVSDIANFVAVSVVGFCPERASEEHTFLIVREDGVGYKVKVRVTPAVKV